MGGDKAHSLPTWREPAAVVELAEIGVAEREGVRRDDIIGRLEEVPGARDRVRFFQMPRLDISSSLVRRRVARGLPVRYLVPDRVAGYIAAEGLYAAERLVPAAGEARP